MRTAGVVVGGLGAACPTASRCCRRCRRLAHTLWLGSPLTPCRRSLAGTKVAHRQPTRPSPSQRSCQRPAVPVAQSAAGGPPAAAEIPAVEATSKQQLDWEAQWWPIVYTKDIPASGIYGFRLLDQPM